MVSSTRKDKKMLFLLFFLLLAQASGAFLLAYQNFMFGYWKDGMTVLSHFLQLSQDKCIVVDILGGHIAPEEIFCKSLFFY